LVQVIDEVFQSILELAIPADIPAKAHIHRLATGVREARELMKNVQLELNLQIVELQLKPQPSTPPEVRDQHANTIIARLDEIGNAV